MPAAWPVVVEQLVAVLPTLPGWEDVEVFDGPPVTGDAPAEYVTVGFVDGEDFGGSYEQTRTGEGGWEGALEESGTVRCEVVVWTGGDDFPAMRRRAFELVDAWEVAISTLPSLGVLGEPCTSSLAVDVQPIQNKSGAAARLTVTFEYLCHSQ